MNMRFALILGLAACVTPSFAAITLQYNSTGLGQSIDYVYNSSAKTGFAGQLNFTDLTNNVALQLYCADLNDLISGGQTYNVNLSPTISDSAYQLAGSIVSNFYSTVTSNDDATALQVAVWYAIYNGNVATNTGGTFQLDSTWYSTHASVVNQAIAMTGTASSNVLDAVLYKADPQGSGQDQIGPVPEPITMLALGAGLAAMARKRRK